MPPHQNPGSQNGQDDVWSEQPNAYAGQGQAPLYPQQSAGQYPAPAAQPPVNQIQPAPYGQIPPVTPVAQPVPGYQQPPVPHQAALPAYPATGAYHPPGQINTPADNPYGFFLDPTHKPKSNPLGGLSKSSMTFKILAGLLVLSVLLIGGLMAAALLTKTPDNAQRLLSIANTQQELIRVSDLGAKNVVDDDLRNFALTNKLSVTSSQQELISFLGRTGLKVDAKQLAKVSDSRTDAALTAAEAANTYDTTFTTIMQSNLAKYENQLRQAAQGSQTQPEQALLAKQHADALLLIKQLGAPPLE